jgi:site-specific DNA recombinase
MSTIRAVGYMRLSADEKQTGSISFSVQAEHIEALSKRIGADLIESVQDNAISGVVPFKKRPGGRRVQSLIGNGAVNAILALRQERLFRDTRETLEYIDLWRQQGVAVYFAEDGGKALDTESPAGKMMLTMKAAVATYERDQTAVRVRENKASRKLQGKTYSPPRYGYDQVDGYEVPNPIEQAVLQSVLQMRSEGLSLRKIGAALDAAGHKPKRRKDGRWSPQAVSDMIGRFDQTPKAQE